MSWGRLRAVRGIEVNEKTLGFDDLAQVCLGDKGHYLGSDHTQAVMQSEYLYPEVGNRSAPRGGPRQAAGDRQCHSHP